LAAENGILDALRRNAALVSKENHLGEIGAPLSGVSCCRCATWQKIYFLPDLIENRLELRERLRL
jgi:hypothetical protein